MMNEKPKSSMSASSEISVSVPFYVVQETSLADAGSNKGLLGLTLNLEGDPMARTHLNPMYVLPPQQAHDLHVRLADACPCCRA